MVGNFSEDELKKLREGEHNPREDSYGEGVGRVFGWGLAVRQHFALAGIL